MPKPRTETPRLSESTYLELVRSLFVTLVPSMIMAALFAMVAAMAAAYSPDWRILGAGIAGSFAGIVRIPVMIGLRRRAVAEDFDAAAARRVEQAYSFVYLAFAGLVGLFAFACLLLAPVEMHMLVATLVVGYAAGVAAGNALRPWIAIPAVLLSVMPAAAGALLSGGPAHLMLALVLCALMAGGIGSMASRYRTFVETTEMRLRFASLARHDPLTGLANRLMLEDAFKDAVASRGAESIVLHCLDLDDFKPVNDAHGHVVGDALLKAVAGRLSRLVRSEDLAVRMGGDEFAILQVGVTHPDQAELTARRYIRAIAEPFTIDGKNIQIGMCVGSAAGYAGVDLAMLLEQADKALYEMKRRGRIKPALAG